MVINIKKRVLTIALGFLALFVILGLGIGNAPQASAEPCSTGEVKVVVVGSGLSVCVPNGQLPTITVTLPRVTSTVTLPRVTATKTVTKIVNGKNVTQTVFVPINEAGGATIKTTIIKRVPGPVTTKTVTVRPDTGERTVTVGSGQTVTKRATITGPTVTSTVTETTHQVKSNEVVITKIKAVGYGILFFIIGAVIAVLLLWAAYTYGWLQGDNGNRRFIKELRDDLKYRD